MSKRRLVEDRAMRDAALEIFKTDMAQIKADLQSKGVGGRVAERLGEGARDLAEDAASAAEANYGKIATLAAGLTLWAFRNPLLSFVAKYLDGKDNEAVADCAQDADVPEELPKETVAND